MSRRFTEEKRAAIAKAYVDGVPIKEIARIHDCDESYPSVLANRLKLDQRYPEGRREVIRAGQLEAIADRRSLCRS